MSEPSSPPANQVIPTPLGTPVDVTPTTQSGVNRNTPRSEHRIPPTPNTPEIKKFEKLFKKIVGKKIKSKKGGVTSRIFVSPLGKRVTKLAKPTRIKDPKEQLERELEFAIKAGNAGIGARVYDNSQIVYNDESGQYYLFLVMDKLDNQTNITKPYMNMLVKEASKLGINVSRNVHEGQFMVDPNTGNYKLINFGLARPTAQRSLKF